jgi:HEAT repeat protein
MFIWLRRLFTREPAVDPLVRQSRSLDADDRRQAAEGLGQTGEAWAAEALVPLLGDTYPAVRATAREGLVRLGAGAIPGLVGGLKSPNPEVGQAAAELLGELRAAEAVEPLLLALKYEKRPVQLAAARALVQVGEPAVEALETVRNDPQPWVRARIEAILAEIAGAVEDGG